MWTTDAATFLADVRVLTRRCSDCGRFIGHEGAWAVGWDHICQGERCYFYALPWPNPEWHIHHTIVDERCAKRRGLIHVDVQ